MKDDIISRQAAIAYSISGMTREIDGEKWIRVSEVRESLKTMPSAQQWIHVSERLPEENGRYLVTNSAWGAMEVDWNVWVNGAWLYPNTKPIAWMPLPEACKTESED